MIFLFIFRQSTTKNYSFYDVGEANIEGDKPSEEACQNIPAKYYTEDQRLAAVVKHVCYYYYYYYYSIVLTHSVITCISL